MLPSGITGAYRLITATGTGTAWLSQDPQTLFTLSGGTGASILPPFVTSDTSAIIGLVTGAAAGTLTITDTSTGHNVEATVFVECRQGYHITGPVELRPVGSFD